MNSPPKERPRATLVGATGREDYGTAYNFLHRLQQPFFAVGFWIEQQCPRIETKNELRKWNRTLEREK